MTYKKHAQTCLEAQNVPLAGLYHGHYGQARATPVATAIGYHHSRPFHAAATAAAAVGTAAPRSAAAGTAAAGIVAAGIVAAAGAGTTAAVAPGQILGSPVLSVGAVPSPCPHRHHPSSHVCRCRSGHARSPLALRIDSSFFLPVRHM